MRSSTLQDTLAPLARLLGAILGPQHAVTAMLAEAAEANMSSAARSSVQERERIQQACSTFSMRSKR